MTIWMWAVVIVILIVVELLTVDLLFASLAIAATAALVANALGYEMPIQGIAFALFAILSLLYAFYINPSRLKSPLLYPLLICLQSRRRQAAKVVARIMKWQAR